MKFSSFERGISILSPLCCTILVKPLNLRRLVLLHDGSIIRSRLVLVDEHLAIGAS